MALRERSGDAVWSFSTGNVAASGLTDLYLQHETSGCIVAWHMNGAALVSQVFLAPACVADPSWRVAGVADFDGDGRKDLVFQHAHSGGIVVWLMAGTVLRQQVSLSPAGVSDPNWQIAAVADLDADARADLVIQNRVDGRMVAWLLRGTVLKRQEFLTPATVADANWRIVGAGDLDGDGRSDLFLQHSASGLLVAWLMNGPALRRQEWLVPNQVAPGWRVAAVMDLNSDNRPDLVLQHANDGRMVGWPLNGTRLIGQLWVEPSQVSDPKWRIVGPR
jgi:hypothetical protein